MSTSQALSIPSFRNDIEVENWCYTPMKTTQINYTWVIDNFSDKLSKIQSPTLSTGDKGSKFTLTLNMHDIDHLDNNGYYSLQIVFSEVSKYPISMKNTFSIVDSNAEKTKSILHEIKRYKEAPIPAETFITKRDLMAAKDQLLPDDQLTLSCEMSVTEEGQQITGKALHKNMVIPASTLSDDFKDIFTNKTHWDVEFIVGPDAQKIHAHKVILTARSSVFRATFENEMKESKNNQVVVSLFSPDVFTEMLRFVYTDRVENLEEMARDLLIIANYYDLERLRMMCEDSLHRNLTVDNAADTLLLADLHNANTLKIHTQNFAKKYGKEFIKTSGFQAMKKKHSKLAMETLTMLTNNPMICPVLSEMDHLFLNAELSDVTLVIGEEELCAHKVILASQSPVFAETFKTSKTPNRLIIEDIQSVIMREVLAYFYTGQLREAHDIDILLKVLPVAETYQIKKLKALCAGKLVKKLDIDTVVPILIEADDYSVPELSKKALDFILTNKAKILSLDNFKQLCSTKPELLFKILALDIQK